MTSFEVLNLFADQLRRISNGTKFKTKVVVLPSSVDEPGLTFKVALLKTYLDTRAEACKSRRVCRIRLTVSGSAISMNGLKQACEAIEILDSYFVGENLRLEETVEGENGMTSIRKIPNTTIRQIVSEEDSFMDSPDSIQVQDIDDERIILITVPSQED